MELLAGEASKLLWLEKEVMAEGGVDLALLSTNCRRAAPAAL